MAGKFKDLEALFDKRRDEQRHGARDDSDREKLSWREKDRRKDRSSHSDQSSGPRDQRPKDRYQDAQAQKMVAAQLSGLFEDKEAKALRQAILDADRAELGDAVAAWIDSKGAFPSDDSDLLEKALGVRKAAHLGMVVEAVAEHLKNTDDVRRTMFLRKLKGKSRTVFDKKVAGTIRAVLAEHGDA